jgi:hypothetical protein
MRAGLVATLLVLAAGCGAGEPIATGPAAEPQLYETNAIVLEVASGGPELCLGGVDDSLPPQCGGPPIANWDWEAVEGEQSVSGTTWGDFHVVGTYDGATFTVSQAGAPAFEPDPLDDSEFDSPCPSPEGGWEVTAWSDNTNAANDYMQAQPDYVRSWVTYIARPTEDAEDPGPYILNVVFTGDAARHEAELRELWSGPLCVVAEDVPSESELEQIRSAVERELEDMGLVLLGSSHYETVEIWVVLDHGGAAQAAFDERYGPGVVRISSALRPVQK